ncbi:hypothetical protein GMRT_10972 [Giardia muris]|uniref:Uncharacterized protein n=1 Tax=Giardia muris TaxID=5742 RepID=A0A4Z1T9Z1_GIAMU|nr:hypothetical protein GMRT_10972 [Giardia muris]|eukprot:TNJ29341.1 hypothetical protein GMRT_10972 [Giardia muris]
MHPCKSWAQALDLAAQKHGLGAWGRELDLGRRDGVVRFSVGHFRDNHLRALITALELGHRFLTEFSIHAADDEVGGPRTSGESPFLPDGCHIAYLGWIGLSKASDQAQSTHRRTVFDRLAVHGSQQDADLRPRSAGKSSSQTPADRIAEGRSRTQRLGTLLKLLPSLLPQMPGLQVLAFYGLTPAVANKNVLSRLLAAAACNSTTYRTLDAIILRNCRLGDEAFRAALTNVSTALSIRLLVLHTCGLTDQAAGAIGAVLTAHKNGRDSRLWELCLKKYGATTQLGGYTSDQLQKVKCMTQLRGITYLDLGFNGFGNELCEALYDSLRDDTYVHSISLDGNTGIKLAPASLLPRCDNGDLDYVFDLAAAPGEVQSGGGSKGYLPVRMAERIAQIDILRHGDLDSAEVRSVVQSICPDYRPSAQSTIISYLATYARTAEELASLLEIKAHPLVQLLLQNTTIVHLLLDETLNPSLLRFVNNRLKANRNLMNAFMRGAGKALAQEARNEQEEETRKAEDGVRALVQRTELVQDPLQLPRVEDPLAMDFDVSTLPARPRSRKGKSISRSSSKPRPAPPSDDSDEYPTKKVTTPATPSAKPRAIRPPRAQALYNSSSSGLTRHQRPQTHSSAPAIEVEPVLRPKSPKQQPQRRRERDESKEHPPRKTASMTVPKPRPSSAASANQRKPTVPAQKEPRTPLHLAKYGSPKVGASTPARRTNKRPSSAAPKAKVGHSPAPPKLEASLSSDSCGGNYDIVHSPTHGSQSSFVRLSQGQPADERPRTSPTSRAAFKYHLDPSLVSFAGIDELDGAADSLAESINAALEGVQDSRYPRHVEAGATLIRERDKEAIYRRMLKEMAESRAALEETSSTEGNDEEEKKRLGTSVPNIQEVHDALDLNVSDLTKAPAIHSSLSTSLEALRSQVRPPETKDVDKLLQMTQGIVQELQESQAKTSSIYRDVFNDVYPQGSATSSDRKPALSTTSPEVSLPIPFLRSVHGSQEGLAPASLSSSRGPSASRHSDFDIGAVDRILAGAALDLESTNDVEHHVDAILRSSAEPPTNELSSISSMRQSIRAAVRPSLAGHVGSEVFETALSSLYTLILYFQKEDRVAAAEFYRRHEQQLVQCVEDIICRCEAGQLARDDISDVLYDFIMKLH